MAVKNSAFLVSPQNDSDRFALHAGDNRIGSDASNDVVIAGGGVVTSHALVRLTGKAIVVQDLGSGSGTFVDGVPIIDQATIKHGDQLRFGKVRLNLEAPGYGAAPGAGAVSKFANRVALLLVLVIVGFILVDYHYGFRISQRMLPGWQPPEAHVAAPAAPVATAPSSHNVAEIQPAATPAAAPPMTSEPPIDHVAASGQSGWLGRVNYYRRLVGLKPVRENPIFSAGDLKHSRYLVKYMLRRNLGLFGGAMHSEDPHDQWYTAEGLAAAEKSDVAPPCSGCPRHAAEDEIDLWMSGPFHRLPILNPALQQSGFGTYSEAGLSADALYVMPDKAPVSRSYEQPIEFPPDKSSLALTIYPEGEWPDGLSACPAYATPAGLPITLQLGPHLKPQVTAHSFKSGKLELEHCVYDATSYTNENPSIQELARENLDGSGAVVLIPKAPLTSGETYSVSITARDKTYAWSFSVR